MQYSMRYESYVLFYNGVRRYNEAFRTFHGKTKPQREINMLAGVGKRFYGEMLYFEGVMFFKERPPSASQPKIRCKGQGLIVANATKRYDKPAKISPARAM